MKANPVNPSIRLAISGIALQIECTSARLARALQARYQDFCPTNHRDDSSSMVVQVRWMADQASLVDADQAIRIEDEKAWFDSPLYHGCIDAAAGRAFLELNSSQPVEGVEYFLRVIYALLAFKQGGFLFHAAGVIRNGRAFLFFGRSGCGKTTVSRLSRFDRVLNDDLLVLLPKPGGWQVYATPFWNPTQVQPTQDQAPLAGLLHLVQDRKVFLEPLGMAQAVAELMASVPVLPLNSSLNSRIFKRCLQLMKTAPVYNLHFLPDDSFWPVVEMGLLHEPGR